MSIDEFMKEYCRASDSSVLYRARMRQDLEELIGDQAIKFAEWTQSPDFKDLVHDLLIVGESTTSKAMWGHFNNPIY